MSKLPRYMPMRASPWPTKRHGASLRWRRISLRSRTRSKPLEVVWIFMAISILRQAGIDNEVSAREAAALVGCEEERHPGHVAGVEPELQGLKVEELLVQLRRQPELLLPLGEDRTRQNAVHPDPRRPQLAGQGTRHP